MDTIIIDTSNSESFRKFRKEIGRYLFLKRQMRNMSLKMASSYVNIRPERIDEIEIGRCNLHAAQIIKLLGLYNAELKFSFTNKNGKENKKLILELL